MEAGPLAAALAGLATTTAPPDLVGVAQTLVLRIPQLAHLPAQGAERAPAQGLEQAPRGVWHLARVLVLVQLIPPRVEQG